MKKIITIALLMFISMTLVGCKDDTPDPIYDDIIFVALGDKNLSIELVEEYIEKGFLAKNGSTDISEFVVIESNVNENISGTYVVTYTLDYNEKVTELFRVVNVLFSNPDCDDVTNTTLQQCSKVWTSYLHTVVSLKMYIDNDDIIDTSAIIEDVEEILSLYNHISDKYALYPGVTNIKTINDNPTDTHEISEELFDLIEFSLDHQEEVGNIFNIALGPVINVWHDYRENCNTSGICEIPTIGELETQNVYTDQSKIIMDRENLTITMDSNMSIDLGGVSKGYISGKIIEYLETYDLHGFLINNGESNISIGGNHPTREGGDFLIAITDPTNVLPYYATAFLGDGEQLVTSGDYQQYFIVDDEIYHHIISGDSLFPDRNCRSVSIITSDPGLADLYSTAIFLMTIEDGISFVDSIDGLEAIWYDLDGTIHFSENFESDYLGAIYE
jgi:thiamine biosynthesis lipoprotein